MSTLLLTNILLMMPVVFSIVKQMQKRKKKAWELLMNKNGHSDFIWMRVQLICECWEASDTKGKEKFLNLAMQDHIDNGLARELAIHKGAP